MPQLCESIAERSRKNERAILHALAVLGQARTAERMGVSESTVSRMKGACIQQFSELLAALDLKAVPIGMQCFDPDYVKALKVMAGVGLKQPEPQSLDWGDQ